MHHTRCAWVSQDPIYQDYHDNVWGRPVQNKYELFAKLCLDGQQAGLSWITILKKQDNYYQAFHQFDPLLHNGTKCFDLGIGIGHAILLGVIAGDPRDVFPDKGTGSLNQRFGGLVDIDPALPRFLEIPVAIGLVAPGHVGHQVADCLEQILAMLGREILPRGKADTDRTAGENTTRYAHGDVSHHILESEVAEFRVGLNRAVHHALFQCLVDLVSGQGNAGCPKVGSPA